MKALTIALLVLLLPSLAEAQYRRGVRPNRYYQGEFQAPPPTTVDISRYVQTDFNARLVRPIYVGTGIGYAGRPLNTYRHYHYSGSSDPLFFGGGLPATNGTSMDLGGGMYSHSFNNGVSGTSLPLGGGMYSHRFSDGSSGTTMHLGGGMYSHSFNPGLSP